MLMKEWDWEKNDDIGLNPHKLIEGSHKKAYWICQIHKTKYSQVIRDKVSGQLTCKKCFEAREYDSRRTRYIRGKKVIAETHPHLVKEWIICEDKRITPFNCVAGTNKKVLWQCCKCGGKYEAYISNRALKGTGCRYCSGQAVLTGFNDLCTINPTLANEWSDKNINKPENVTAFSKKKYYWKCIMGHEDYLMTVQQRSNGSGCPICAQQKQTSFPEQALFYYIKKIYPDTLNRFIFHKKYEVDIYIPSKKLAIEYNGYFSHKDKELKDKVKKENILKNGVKLIVVKEFKHNHEINNADYYINQRTSTSDLNSLINKIINDICEKKHCEIDVKKDMIKIQEQYIILQSEKSIARLRPDLVNEWDYVGNGKITPDLVTVGSSKKYYWICPICGESYLCAPKNKIKGTSCPICARKKVLKGVNDFASKYPNLLKYWDYEKNQSLPDEIYFNSGNIYSWICEKGHSFTSSIQQKVKSKSCPICSNRRVLKGFNDFASQCPDLLEEWDYELNLIKPDEIYFKNQSQQIHWVCKKCGYKWTSKILERTNCNNCKNEYVYINVYNALDFSYYGTFKNAHHLCDHLGINYNNQNGNISQVCMRKQKTLLGKFILRHPYDDEYKK